MMFLKFMKKTEKVEKVVTRKDATVVPGNVIKAMKEVHRIVRKTKLNNKDKSVLLGCRLEIMGFSSKLPTGSETKSKLIETIKKAGRRL